MICIYLLNDLLIGIYLLLMMLASACVSKNKKNRLSVVLVIVHLTEPV